MPAASMRTASAVESASEGVYWFFEEEGWSIVSNIVGYEEWAEDFARCLRAWIWVPHSLTYC